MKVTPLMVIAIIIAANLVKSPRNNKIPAVSSQALPIYGMNTGPGIFQLK
jgi:hypothetical protein